MDQPPSLLQKIQSSRRWLVRKRPRRPGASARQLVSAMTYSPPDLICLRLWRYQEWWPHIPGM
jgi:hypothetical protein